MSESLIKKILKHERYDIHFVFKIFIHFWHSGLRLLIFILLLLTLLLLNTFEIIFLLMSLSSHKRAFLFRKTPSAIKEVDSNIQRPKTQGQSETQKQNHNRSAKKLEKHE
jgi:hypothetical protein